MSRISKTLWFGVLLITAALFGGGTANAANLNYSADTMFSMGSGVNTTITVLTGSGADSLIVNAGTLVVTVPTSTLFSVSAPYQILVSGATSDAVVNQGCSGSQVHTVTIPASNPTLQNLTFSAASYQCGGISVSAGAGPLGLTPATSTPPVTPPVVPTPPDTVVLIASLEQQIRELQAQIAALMGQSVVQTPTTRFSRNLQVGMSGEDVRALQEFLKVQGMDIYPEGIVSGYFGQLTKQAVGRWQVRQGIVAADSSALGSFGPLTRAAINAITAP